MCRPIYLRSSNIEAPKAELLVVSTEDYHNINTSRKK